MYDGSPLDRTTFETGEGESFSAHPVSTDYLLNTSAYSLNCNRYEVLSSDTFLLDGTYPSGSLSVSRVTDENGDIVYLFADSRGNPVLRRAMTGTFTSADTYYLYDYRGNLS